MVCESCKRMLYWNPPQSFDDATAAQGLSAAMHKCHAAIEPAWRCC